MGIKLGGIQRKAASMNFIAHGPAHPLHDHLLGVASSSAGFMAAPAADWARLAGLWHDLGKFRPGFQAYVRQEPDAHVEGRSTVSADKTHSAAGAMHALQAFGNAHPGDIGRSSGWMLAHLIAAHHAGLYDHQDLLERLIGGGAAEASREHAEALAACRQAHAELLDIPTHLDPRSALIALPGLVDAGEPLAQSLALRMLFSALVDADFLDTEAYFDRDRSEHRAGFRPLAEYRAKLDAHLHALTESVKASGRADEPVMRARAQVLADCRDAAARPPGVFSLQVPTGGGKTLASLAFALMHAERHGLSRVIVAIPYTSIVEQTVQVLSGIFGRDAVVEHHSQASEGGEGDEGSRATARSRLACENWDAPLIVTTNVQLLESLFAARTSRCRKLHRLQRSVIVLDEAQVLPPPFLQPTLDALRALVRHWGASIVSCTATQPVLTDIRRFDPRQGLRGLTRKGEQPSPIVNGVEPLYDALQRVAFHWPEDLNAEAGLAEIAARMVSHEAVLAIVNTRQDAADLLREVDALADTGEPALHLSAAMCGQHRADVVAQIRRRLNARIPGDSRSLRVVSTQLVEAGVDLDFPVVFRALAGLDAIAQAAGRCNREGRLGPGGGRVELFVRPIPGSLASLVRAVAATRAVLAKDRPAELSPAMFQRYFEHWYGLFGSLDEKGIVQMLGRRNDFYAMQFRSAAQAYRLVDDEDQCSVVVPYAPLSADTAARDAALSSLNAGKAERWHMRALQRYVVQAPRRDVLTWLALGDVCEPMPGWFVLRDDTRYDSRRGLLRDGAVLDARTLAQ